MSNDAPDASAPRAAAPTPATQHRLFTNLVTGWAAYVVALVIGFLMPRLINQSLGSVALGIWDLCWSLLAYITLSGTGLATGVTHYVARYGAERHPGAVRTTIASGFYCQLVFAACAMAGLLLVTRLVPGWMEEAATYESIDVEQLGLLLAATVFLALIGDVAQGVLTGVHRGAINQIVMTAMDIVLAIAMVVVVLSGQGILGLALATFVVRALAELLRVALAMRVCREMSIAPSDFSPAHARRLIYFATKSSVGLAQEFLVQQTTRVLLIASAGPIALACYSRYATLIRQTARLVERVAFVIPPMTSGFVGLGHKRPIQTMSTRAGAAAVLVTLPMAITLGVFGDLVIALWMGPTFVVPGVAWVMAGLAFVQAERSVADRILTGMNTHGTIALLCLGTGAVALLLMLLLFYPLDPLRAALVVTTVMIVGIYVPHLLLAARKVGVPVRVHLREVYLRPVLCNVPYLAALLIADHLLDAGDPAGAVLTFLVASGCLGLLYWRVGLDAEIRNRIRARLGVRSA